MRSSETDRQPTPKAFIYPNVGTIATGNLDSRSADDVFELLRQFNRDHGTTVLFVTHNPMLAERSDGTIEVIDGKVT